MTELPTAIPGYLFIMVGWAVLLFVLLWGLLILRRRWKGSVGRGRVVNALLALWMLLLTTTVAEVAFASLYDHTDSFAKTNVSKRWFDRHVKLNDAGFRDSNPFPPEGSTGRLIVFAGDSFTFGHGVKNPAHRFSDLVAAELDASRPGEFRVSNTGLPGLGIRQLIAQVEDWAKRNFPVKTLVYTVVLNDIENLEPATGEFYNQLNALDPNCIILKSTYLPNFLYYRLQAWRQPASRNYYDYLADAWAGDTWRKFSDQLDRLHQACVVNGIELKLAVFPFLHNLDDEYPFTRAHERLQQYCNKHEIPCADLLPAMRGRSDNELTVNRFDAHPNELAHRLAAEVILRELFGELPGNLTAGAGVEPR